MSVKISFAATFIGAVLLLGASAAPASAYVLGPTFPGKWGPAAMGTGATVTWSLMATGTSLDNEVSGSTASALADFMPFGFEAEIANAFDAWSTVADLTFIKVADAGEAYNSATQLSGDIRLGGHAFDGPSGVLAHGYYPPDNDLSAAGDIHFDTADTWKIGFGGPGFDIFQVTAHEIGHAIGLDHLQTSVGTALMNPTYTEAFSGLLADDIAGAQFIYGPVAVVPLPAALPLFGSAMAVMGLVGWRKKRRAAA